MVGEEDPFARICECAISSDEGIDADIRSVLMIRDVFSSADQDGAKIPSKAGDLKVRKYSEVRGALSFRGSNADPKTGRHSSALPSAESEELYTTA